MKNIDLPIDPMDDPAGLGQLIAEAGARPPLPEEDLAAIRQAARFAWEVRERRRRRDKTLRVAASLAAVLALVTLGLFLGRLGGRSLPGPATGTELPLVVASIERVTGEIEARAGTGPATLLAAGDPLVEGVSLTTSVGARASLRLLSGFAVRIDRSSVVRLDGASRITLEAGALYADSGPARQGAHSLAITTPLGTVHDIGTQFMVRIDEGSGTLSVSVREGRVELRRAGDTLATSAGEALFVARDGKVQRAAAAAGDESWRWATLVSPIFLLEGKTFGEFLAWFGRETGREVTFESPTEEVSARAVVLHGSLGELGPDAALETVAAGAGYEVAAESGRTLLRAVRIPSGSRR